MRNSSVGLYEISECYRLNHAIVVQAACQAVFCGTMCFQAACKLVANRTYLRDGVIVLFIVL